MKEAGILERVASEFHHILQNTQSQVTLQMSIQMLLPVKTPVFRVGNISDITGLRIQLYINCYQDVSRLRSLAVEAWNTALEVNLTKARAVTWFHGYRYKMMQTYTNKFYNTHIYIYIYTYICIDRLRTRKSSSRSIFDGELEGKSSKKLEIQ